MNDSDTRRLVGTWKVLLWSGLLLISVALLLDVGTHSGWCSRLAGFCMAGVIVTAFQVRFAIGMVLARRIEKQWAAEKSPADGPEE